MRKFKAETIVAKLFTAMTDRRAALVAGDFVVPDEMTKKNGLIDNFNPEGNSYRNFLVAVENTKAIFDFEPLLKIATKHKPNGSNDAQYVQAKALEKIVKFVKAFGHKDFRVLDNHTRSITMNAMVNNGAITSRSAFATLVRVEYDALESQDERLVMRNSYTAGTGSTQLSSTRELFRILGLTDGIKGAKDAPIVFTDEAKAALTQHFEPIAKRTGAVIEQQDDDVSEGEMHERAELESDAHDD
jgi:hypothetical protein